MSHRCTGYLMFVAFSKRARILGLVIWTCGKLLLDIFRSGTGIHRLDRLSPLWQSRCQTHRDRSDNLVRFQDARLQ